MIYTRGVLKSRMGGIYFLDPPRSRVRSVKSGVLETTILFKRVAHGVLFGDFGVGGRL